MHGEGNPLTCACGMRGPSPYGKRGRCFHRRAGACPPRSFQAPSRGGLSLAIVAWRGTGPRPTVKGAFFIVTVPDTVARGPVPRDRLVDRSMARETRSHARVACEGPSPTVKGAVVFTVARGSVPRVLLFGPTGCLRNLRNVDLGMPRNI